MSIEKILGNLNSNENVVLFKWNSHPKVRWLLRIFVSLNLITPFLYCLFQWKSFVLDYFFIILPSLKKGKIVIADRYVYTAFTRDTLHGVNKKIICFLYAFARKPDLLLFFKTPPEVCMEWSRKSGKRIFHLCRHIRNSSVIEDKEMHYLRELYCNYMKIFDEFGIYDSVNLLHIGDSSCDDALIEERAPFCANIIRSVNRGLVNEIEKERRRIWTQKG